MFTSKKTICIAGIFCISNASPSLSQEKLGLDKEFSQKYAFVQDLKDLRDMPFAEVSEEDAKRILATSTHFFAPFGAQLPIHSNHYFYQIFGIDCVSCPSAVRYYLVAQGGLGNAITRVYGPIDFK